MRQGEAWPGRAWRGLEQLGVPGRGRMAKASVERREGSNPSTPRMTGHGEAGLGMAWLGEARLGKARQGSRGL